MKPHESKKAKMPQLTHAKQKATVPIAPPSIPVSIPSNYRVAYSGSRELKVSVIHASEFTSEQFYTQFVSTRKPVLIRGGVDSGSEFHSLLSQWRSLSFLHAHAGEKQVRIEHKPREKGSFGRGVHEWMKFSQFLDQVTSKKGQQQRDLYLTSQPIPERSDGAPMDLCAEPIQSLLADMPLQPKLLSALVPVQYNCWIGGYSGSAVAASTAPQSKFGPRDAFHRSIGTSSGLHHDFHDNIYLLLNGHKHFHLYPPSDAPFVYTHGLLFGRQRRRQGGEGEDDDDADEEEEEDPPACILHENGVIEYVTQSELESEENGTVPPKQKSVPATSGTEKLAKKRQQQLEAEMKAELEEEEEEEEDGTEEIPNADSTAAAGDDALSLHISKLAAITEQIAELETALKKVMITLKFETQEKRKKHLTLEKQGLEKKLTILRTRRDKCVQEEKERLKEIEERRSKKVSDGDDATMGDASESDADDDGGEFPSAEDLDAMQDDYQESDQDDGEDGEDQDEEMMDGSDENDEDSDEEDDDDEIDPAEKAAWEAFMKATTGKKGKMATVSVKKNSKSSVALASALPKGKQLAGSKRKQREESDNDDEETDEPEGPPTKRAKSDAPTSSNSSSSSTPSSSTFFPDNFSRIDFSTMSPTEIRSRFPLFAHHCHPIVVEVREGEMLYLPASWFHEVFSSGSAPIASDDDRHKGDLPPSVHFALNYWFQPPSSSTSSSSVATTTTSFHSPYSKDDQHHVKRFKEYYLPRVQKMKRLALKKQQTSAVATTQAKQRPSVVVKSTPGFNHIKSKANAAKQSTQAKSPGARKKMS